MIPYLSKAFDDALTSINDVVKCKLNLQENKDMFDLDNNNLSTIIKEINDGNHEIITRLIVESLETKNENLSFERLEKAIKCLKNSELSSFFNINKNMLLNKIENIYQTNELKKEDLKCEDFFIGKSFLNNNKACAKLLVENGMQGSSSIAEYLSRVRNYPLYAAENDVQSKGIKGLVASCIKSIEEDGKGKASLLFEAKLFDKGSVINQGIPQDIFYVLCDLIVKTHTIK